MANGCEAVKNCPAEDVEWKIKLPNPSDCSSYCRCDWGNAVWVACPDGLHFNAELEVCDWPANAGCDPNAAA